MSNTKLSIIHNVLIWLSGKKSVIASLIGTITAYLAVKGFLGEAEVGLIGSISFLFFGTASMATSSAFKKLNK